MRQKKERRRKGKINMVSHFSCVFPFFWLASSSCNPILFNFVSFYSRIRLLCFGNSPFSVTKVSFFFCTAGIVREGNPEIDLPPSFFINDASFSHTTQKQISTCAFARLTSIYIRCLTGNGCGREGGKGINKKRRLINSFFPSALPNKRSQSSRDF